MSAGKAKARPQRATREQRTKVRMKDGHVLAIMRPEATQEDRQALLRQLQQALALAMCIQIAAEYGDEDERLDLADAVAGLVILLERATATLDAPGGAS